MLRVFCCVENGVDGLQFTRSWLASSAERVKTRQLTTESTAASAEASAAASAETSRPVTSTTANATLNAAFLELLQWDDDRIFPEVISTPSRHEFALVVLTFYLYLYLQGGQLFKAIQC